MDKYFNNADTLVACIGTQHTFGMSYPDGNYKYEDTWPGQLAQLIGHNCLNYGVTGSSIQPFGERILKIKEFLRPSQMGILVAVFLFWWSHKFISVGAQRFLSFDFTELIERIA